MVLMKMAKMYFKPLGLLKLAPYLLIVPIIVFHALCLTGCLSTSPAIPNIYLVALRSAHNTSAAVPLQVRIGYHGICGIDAHGTRCQSARGSSADALAAALFPDPPTGTGTGTGTTTGTTTARALPARAATPTETTDLITTALALQQHTFTPVLAAGGVLFVLGLAALALLKRDVAGPAAWDHPRRSTLIRRATCGLLSGSAALVFAAALATTQAAGALEFATAGMADASVLARAGTTLQVLQWTVLGLEVVFGVAAPFLVRSEAAGEGEYKGEV
ncbi:hypothetical protein BT67DRAFT_447487 [Trichocladium antarcticum]|uniref:Uncharacterized protein n=1 Tax=Trichocladium antarcticum TaxID=1450529 RepID=A0AAN6ZHH8_9PEZI|nr:hypothetical protein BT67DRAFT_447487 [Trichocladium antarcticum]